MIINRHAWRLALALLLIAVSGCSKRAESTVMAGDDMKVDRLFTVDGCTVYRFRDAGHERYFTNCRGSASWSESCGKNCVRQVEVPGGAP